MTLDPNATDTRKLGTLGGVFTPSLLTILGLVLFLRLGFVTGNMGLGHMLLILGLATSVSILTTVSLAAIATNLKVGGGGVYFLISRTLGPAFGGAIGVVLYIAMSVSVAFYAIGLGEALASILGSDSATLPRVIAAFAIVALLALAWLGADIATRLQYVVMGCLVLALVGYFAGAIPDLSVDQLGDNIGRPAGGESFWVAFAIFFPAITGFTQGVAMSGDLRTPSRSITTGTFAAIGVSTLVYLLVIITFVMAAPAAELRDDTAIMRRLSLSPVLVDVGVIAATLSSAIASMLGAPRTLQRLSADKLMPPLNPFAVGAGPDNNPRRAVLLTTAIALGTVAVGDLDKVAPIISMFFLASYGMINFATYSEGRAANTSFRPRFRFYDWRLSLLGTIACIGVILAIDPVAGAVAGLGVYGLYRYLRRSVQHVRWADSTGGFHAAEVRSHLQLLNLHAASGRDWRPCTVAFAPRDPDRRSRLVAVASWFEGGAGFTTVARIVPGRGPVARKHAALVDQRLQRELAAQSPSVYARVIVAADLEAGVAGMIQSHGIASLRPNLALFSWYDPHDPEGPDDGGSEAMVQTALRFGCSAAVVHAPDDAWRRVPASAGDAATIGVWWSDDKTGRLLTLLAWMCTRADSVWSDARILVWVAEAGGDAAADRVAALLDDARLPVTVEGWASPDAFVETVRAADFVLAPLRVRDGQSLSPGGAPLDQVIPHLPLAVFAHVGTEVELDLQPDEGEVAALAEARDRAVEAAARAEELDREASTLMVEVEMLRLEAGVNGESDPPEIAARSVEATRSHRRYLDARARSDEAWRLVREIDPTHGAAVDPELWLEPEPEQVE